MKLETFTLIERACKNEIERRNLKEMKDLELNERLIRLPFKMQIQDLKDLSKAIDERTAKDNQLMEEEELQGLKEEFPDYRENIEQTIIGEEMIEEDDFQPDKEIQSSSNEIFKAINLLKDTNDLQDELIIKCREKFNILYPLFSKL